MSNAETRSSFARRRWASLDPRVSAVAFQAPNTGKLEPEIAHLREEALKRGLVFEPADEVRLVRPRGAHLQAREPADHGPSEAAADHDLVVRPLRLDHPPSPSLPRHPTLRRLRPPRSRLTPQRSPPWCADLRTLRLALKRACDSASSAPKPTAQIPANSAATSTELDNASTMPRLAKGSSQTAHGRND